MYHGIPNSVVDKPNRLICHLLLLHCLPCRTSCFILCTTYEACAYEYRLNKSTRRSQLIAELSESVMGTAAWWKS